MDKSTSPQMNDAEAHGAQGLPGGQVERLVFATDWSKTQLGPIESWPTGLKTLLEVILASRFPMLLWWGRDLLHFYNDAVLPILSDKHPAALGAPAAQVWTETWSIAGPMAQSILQGGPATWAEDLQLFINRAGIAEESHFTFSFSPAPHDGQVGGVLITVQESTAKVRSERQIRMLHELAARASTARCEDDAYRLSLRVLADNELDLPFVLLYELGPVEGEARLVGASGWAGYEGPAKPARLSLEQDAADATWPLAEVVATGRATLIEDLSRRFGALPAGRCGGPPERALALPLSRAGQSTPYAVLVAGISPHRPFDEWYRRFFEATADQFMAVVEHARAHGEERQRAREFAELARQRREWQDELERRVAERTAALAAMAQQLKAENERSQSAERRLQAAYDELRRTQRTVLQQERLRALGQMASGIAHDINNAISPAALYVESLLESEPGLSARARQYLPVVLRAIGDVESTVDRMREFYRSREHDATLISVDLNELAEQTVELTRARWNDMPMRRGVVIDIMKELAHGLPPVLGIETEIRMAITNLIFNAVDAMPEGGTLLLRTSELPLDQVDDEPPASRRGVCLEVADTGIGMDEETSSKCLEPFFTTKGERGTGLGLAMVYGAAQRHGAEIEIDSAPGRGTSIRIIFPAPIVARTEDAHPKPPVTAKRLRLLIIDDDPLVLKSLSDTLEADGHAAVIAADSRHGIDTFRCAQLTEPFSAVITDLGMPHLDGYAVAKAIKETSPMTPVILLTGWGRRLEPDNDAPPNVDRVLAKPPKLRELRAALAECCSIRERGDGGGDALDSMSFG